MSQKEINTMTINDIEYVRKDSIVKETIKPIYEGDFQPFEIGAIYLIRTVTWTLVGRVVAASHRWVVLTDAAWVADTGRFANAIKDWEFNEVEPFPEGLHIPVGAGTIVDAVPGKSTLRDQK